MLIHVTNAAGLNATLRFEELKPEEGPTLGLPGAKLGFKRFLAATPAGLHERLAQLHGAHYAQALIDGDPEVDIERVGQQILRTEGVYLSGEGAVMSAPPEFIEVLYDAAGAERERRAFKDIESNTNTYYPLRRLGAPLAIHEMIRRYVIRRSVQIYHDDGLSFEFLYQIAKELSERGEVVMLGAGVAGQSPLVFQQNGVPYRGFLEGRVEGEAYQLLLHLSNMELRSIEEDA